MELEKNWFPNMPMRIMTSNLDRQVEPTVDPSDTNDLRGSRNKQGSASSAAPRRAQASAKVRRPVEVPLTRVPWFPAVQTSTIIFAPAQEPATTPVVSARTIRRGAGSGSMIGASYAFPRPRHWGDLTVFWRDLESWEEVDEVNADPRLLPRFSAGTPVCPPVTAPTSQGLRGKHAPHVRADRAFPVVGRAPGHQHRATWPSISVRSGVPTTAAETWWRRCRYSLETATVCR